MNQHPLLEKYKLPNRLMFDRKDVVSICEQLDWAERELDKEKGNASHARASARRQVHAVRRRWVKAPPNPTVAAHRTKPTAALGLVMTAWPAIQWYLEKEPSPVTIAIGLTIAVFLIGQYLIHLFLRSV